MATYKVEILASEDEHGAQTWEAAARWPDDGEPRQMSYGPATGLTREQAEHTARRINASHGVTDGMARIVEDMTLALQAKIFDRGDGLPRAGDYCSGDDPDGALQLYRVESIGPGPVGDPRGRWVYAAVTPVRHSACPESAEHSALIELVKP